MEVSMEVMKGAPMVVAGSFHGIIFHGDGSSFGGSTQEFPVEASTAYVEAFSWKRLPRNNIATSMEAVEASTDA